MKKFILRSALRQIRFRFHTAWIRFGHADCVTGTTGPPSWRNLPVTATGDHSGNAISQNTELRRQFWVQAAYARPGSANGMLSRVSN
jgi:hypothetical protein